MIQRRYFMSKGINEAERNYKMWIADISQRFKKSQIKAASKVNEEMLFFYWQLGKEIEGMKTQNLYGSGFYERLSKDLAQAITKDPYNFDFLTLRCDYDEKELKDALMDNIQNFLLELGTGFAFVGREYRLLVGKTELFIDMLFYNITMHCYVVVEVKVREFTPADIGQTGTYADD